MDKLTSTLKVGKRLTIPYVWLLSLCNLCWITDIFLFTVSENKKGRRRFSPFKYFNYFYLLPSSSIVLNRRQPLVTV